MTRMRVAAAIACIVLAGCDDQPDRVHQTPGARLERAAMASGLVTDPDRIDLTGSWARDTDRLCILPGEAGDVRIGALIDYGEGQGCAASGTGRRRGDRLSIRFGGCRFDAVLDGERLTFPAEMPGACDRACTGRASLAALAVDRLSTSRSEARTLRTPAGRALCGG